MFFKKSRVQTSTVTTPAGGSGHWMSSPLSVHSGAGLGETSSGQDNIRLRRRVMLTDDWVASCSQDLTFFFLFFYLFFKFPHRFIPIWQNPGVRRRRTKGSAQARHRVWWCIRLWFICRARFLGKSWILVQVWTLATLTKSCRNAMWTANNVKNLHC